VVPLNTDEDRQLVTRLLTPTGHLGFTMLERESFLHGMQQRPDFVIADSGSCDIGPHPLGSDEQCSPVEWQTHDLEIMLVESRKLGVPMIIGSASDTGTDRGVDLYAGIIREVAQRHHLAPFKLACIYSNVSLNLAKERMAAGIRFEGLDGRPDLTMSDLEQTSNIVAVMGVEPILQALQAGADVIICGRSSDPAIFAAPLLWRGYDPATAYYAGKVLECASFVAEPYMGKESILGEVHPGEIIVEAMHPGQRCTPSSVASHAMYERSTPFYEHVPGGVLDMSQCLYQVLDERRTRVTGFTFKQDEVVKVKLEGAGKTGDRCLAIVGFRDPFTIARIDQVIEWARQKVKARFGTEGYELHYHIYGRNGVMGELEPLRNQSHELCVVVEGVAPDRRTAEELTAMGSRQMFYARLQNVKGTAGTAALMSDEVLHARAAYTWTINHIIPVQDPGELFRVILNTVE
jgi:hypothetical protein